MKIKFKNKIIFFKEKKKTSSQELKTQLFIIKQLIMGKNSKLVPLYQDRKCIVMFRY